MAGRATNRWRRLGIPVVAVVVAGSVGAAAVLAMPHPLGIDVVSSPAAASMVAERHLAVAAEADATLDGAAPSTATGGSSSLVLSTSPQRDVLLRFDLSGMRFSSEVLLRLHPTTALPTGTTLAVDLAWLSDTGWSESSVRAADAPTVDGAFRRVSAVVAADGWLEADLVGVVGGGALATLRLRAVGAASTQFDSRETGAAPVVRGRVGIPSTSSTVRMWAVGDLACPGGEAVERDACHQWAVSNLIAADPEVDAFAALGDLQYPNGTYADFLTGYAPSYGRFLDLTLPAPGNHEYNTDGAAGYGQYFGDRGHLSTGGWYSADIGTTWHVVVLNSNCDEVDCRAGSAQERWLRADLAASTRPCTIGVWHHPRFSSGERYSVDPDIRPLWQALADDRAELILNGHEHVYERFHRQTVDGAVDPTGIRQIIVGGGGRSLYGFATPLPSSSVRLVSFGALRLDLAASGYTWSFVDETGAVLDSGTGTCS